MGPLCFGIKRVFGVSRQIAKGLYPAAQILSFRLQRRQTGLRTLQNLAKRLGFDGLFAVVLSCALHFGIVTPFNSVTLPVV